jgi:hypothetical protein
MTRAGMQAYEAEWWHYNAPESQMGAAAAGLPKATYGAAIFDAKNAAHESLRQSIPADPKIATQWPAEIIGPQRLPQS